MTRVTLYDHNGVAVKRSPSQARLIVLGMASMAVTFLLGVPFVVSQHGCSHHPKPTPAPATAKAPVGTGIILDPHDQIIMATYAETIHAEQLAEERLEEHMKQWTWEHRPILSPPPGPPPSVIRVGPYFYTLHWTSTEALHAANALSLMSTDTREIWLSPARRSSLRGDLVHELLHAARDLGSGGGRLSGTSGEEEDTIEASSDAWLEIMQDNPQLVRWLTARKS